MAYLSQAAKTLERYNRAKMIFKVLILSLSVACAYAAPAPVLAPVGIAYGGYGGYGGYASPYSAYPAQPAIATQQQNILRTPYNLGQVTSFSKTVDTPYSSVSKSDVRVSNPGIAVASPAYHGLGYGGLGYAAPALATPYGYGAIGAPVAKVATAGLLGVAYSAAPAVSTMTYSNGLGLSYAW